MKRPPTLSDASAAALKLASSPRAQVIHLPARVPLDAPTLPERLVHPWERAVPPLLMLALVVLWFFTAVPVAT